MSSSTLKPVACRMSPATGANERRLQVSRVSMMKTRALPPPQVKEKEKPLLQESFKNGASRRELFHLTATSLGLLSILPPAHAAEGQTKNASVMEKIIGKLQELAGLSKPKDGAKEKRPDNEAKETKPKLKDDAEKKNTGGEVKKAPNEKPYAEAPTTTIDGNGKTVETAALP